MPPSSFPGRRVLFLQRAFPPDPAAAGEMLCQLGEYLGNRGWDVHIACAGISLPEKWRDPTALAVHRARSIPYRRTSFLARAFSMWRTRRALARVAQQSPKPDIVVSLTDPPGLIRFGDQLARRHSAAHVHWSQDVYPEIAERLGVISPGNPLAIRLRRQSISAMQRARKVISLGRCMTRLLAKRGAPEGQIATIPNWAAPGLFAPVASAPADQDFRRRLGLDGGFLALYSGNLGLAHEFTTLLDCAALLETQNAPVQIAFVGSGPRLAATQGAAGNLKSVRFLERLATGDYARLLKTADIHLITLDPRIAGCVVPSKLYACLASGRGVIYVGPPETEVEYTLRETGAGLALRNGDARGLCDLLLALAADPVRAAGMAAAAAAAAPKFTLEMRGAEIEAVLASAASSGMLTVPGRKSCAGMS